MHLRAGSLSPRSLSLAAVGAWALGACAPAGEPVSLEGTDLLASFGTGADAAIINVTFAGLDVTTGACPIIPLEGVTWDGKAVPAGDVVLGGEIADEGGSCAPPSVRVATEARDPDEDGELIIESGGGTVRWVGQNLMANRGFSRAGGAGASDQVPRGSIVRIDHTPASDLLAEPTSVTLTDAVSVDAEFRVDNDGIIVTIPDDASPGGQTLDVTVEIEVPQIACEGFASCVMKTETVGQIDIVISP